MGCFSSKPAHEDQHPAKPGKQDYGAEQGYGHHRPQQDAYQSNTASYYEYGIPQQQHQGAAGFDGRSQPWSQPGQQFQGQQFQGQQQHPAPGYPAGYPQPPPGYPGAQPSSSYPPQMYSQYPPYQSQYQQPQGQYQQPHGKPQKPQKTGGGFGTGAGIAAGAVGGLAAAMLIGDIFD
jgi:hypothetical protein